jgi:hypothetical protein
MKSDLTLAEELKLWVDVWERVLGTKDTPDR